MIRSIKDKRMRRLANGSRVADLPAEIQPKSTRLLRTMAECEDWNELRNPPGNKLPALVETAKGNMLYGSTGNGGSPSRRLMEHARMSKSQTFTTDDWSNDPND